MDKKYDFELPLSRRDYSALMDIRGLASGAHMMVMCADMKDDGQCQQQCSIDLKRHVDITPRRIRIRANAMRLIHQGFGQHRLHSR